MKPTETDRRLFELELAGQAARGAAITAQEFGESAYDVATRAIAGVTDAPTRVFLKAALARALKAQKQNAAALRRSIRVAASKRAFAEWLKAGQPSTADPD